MISSSSYICRSELLGERALICLYRLCAVPDYLVAPLEAYLRLSRPILMTPRAGLSGKPASDIHELPAPSGFPVSGVRSMDRDCISSRPGKHGGRLASRSIHTRSGPPRRTPPPCMARPCPTSHPPSSSTGTPGSPKRTTTVCEPSRLPTPFAACRGVNKVRRFPCLEARLTPGANPNNLLTRCLPEQVSSNEGNGKSSLSF